MIFVHIFVKKVTENDIFYRHLRPKSYGITDRIETKKKFVSHRLYHNQIKRWELTMKGSWRLSFQKGDWFAIIGVVALTIAVACFYGSLSSTEGVATVQIFQDNQLLKEVSFRLA